MKSNYIHENIIFFREITLFISVKSHYFREITYLQQNHTICVDSQCLFVKSHDSHHFREITYLQRNHTIFPYDILQKFRQINFFTKGL